MFRFSQRGESKNGQENVAGCGKYTEARMEDTKDWSASSLLISAGLEESFVLSCADNWRAVSIKRSAIKSYTWISNKHLDIGGHPNMC